MPCVDFALDSDNYPVDEADIYIYSDSFSTDLLTETQSKSTGDFIANLVTNNDKVYLNIEKAGYQVISGLAYDLFEQDTPFSITLAESSIEQLVAYPNPFTDSIAFGLKVSDHYQNPQEEEYKLLIYDLSGKLVLEKTGHLNLGKTEDLNQQVAKKENSIILSNEVRDFVSGVYIYSFKKGKLEQTGKIMKK